MFLEFGTNLSLGSSPRLCGGHSAVLGCSSPRHAPAVVSRADCISLPCSQKPSSARDCITNWVGTYSRNFAFCRHEGFPERLVTENRLFHNDWRGSVLGFRSEVLRYLC